MRFSKNPWENSEKKAELIRFDKESTFTILQGILTTEQLKK